MVFQIKPTSDPLLLTHRQVCAQENSELEKTIQYISQFKLFEIKQAGRRTYRNRKVKNGKSRIKSNILDKQRLQTIALLKNQK